MLQQIWPRSESESHLDMSRSRVISMAWPALSVMTISKSLSSPDIMEHTLVQMSWIAYKIKCQNKKVWTGYAKTLYFKGEFWGRGGDSEVLILFFSFYIVWNVQKCNKVWSIYFPLLSLFQKQDWWKLRTFFSVFLKRSYSSWDIPRMCFALLNREIPF